MSHHEHQHHLHHNPKGKGLLVVTLLNLSITLVQIVGGVVSNSLSLLSDAFHNLGDTTALFIAYLAGKVSEKKPDAKKTFGYKRIEILAAMFNGAVLIAICLFLLYEAYKRFMSPEPIQSGIMLSVAVFGLLANLVSMLLLKKDREHSLNIKAAYLHLLGDTLSSVAVIVGGIVMWQIGWYWIDPMITVFVSLYIIYHTWDVIKETVEILMQSSPDGVDIEEIKYELEMVDEVENIHHIHIWKLNDAQTHFEAHINLKNNIRLDEMMKVKNQIELLLKEKFHMVHTTLQIGYGCCNGTEKVIQA
ncbi:MAG TPA: cation transporter [Marinilabiliales bacterium]|nr:MAG: cobalt transporter [Bacteroidetes bacterium GWC2_40_13]OFX74184.1 MAG: cobalt transporter [Bacteroidetes bacterium GWD2_40_43]OFX92982.1 MAG: cobalt transporter [Bacteroidetes bacterium GWE2_40_63]OFY21351.1 MAG: cobalt transporter [Bacteroidetes bacterium GWF2_40_13]OFZ30979.1 MAG: cobalt transporter [Bacteroidetes bacterium RIFOXYC2_FULL_40_12]HAM98266.1 cation transporter [Marinilabiliales bacterium]